MRIEEVEEMFNDWANAESSDVPYGILQEALDALQAEAWYPIERAEEMGVKDGSRYLVAFARLQPDFAVYILGKWYKSGVQVETPTHFKLISPPEVN